MKKEDENELYRLTEMLREVASQIEPASQHYEALEKSALALQFTFLHGYRYEIEKFFDNKDKSLSDKEKEYLKRIGIYPNTKKRIILELISQLLEKYCRNGKITTNGPKE